MLIPVAAAAARSETPSLPAVVRAATSATPGPAQTTGDLPGSPFAVGQFVTILALNSTDANAVLSSPASGAEVVYNDDNGTRAANIWTIDSLASATQTITYNNTRTRSRTIGWENVQTGLVDWDVTYGTTPLAPGELDVSGKPRAMIYSVIFGGTNTYTAPANLTDDGGANGLNGWRRAGTTAAVGAVSSFQIANWTSSDNGQQAVCVSIAVE